MEQPPQAMFGSISSTTTPNSKGEKASCTKIVIPNDYSDVTDHRKQIILVSLLMQVQIFNAHEQVVSQQML